MRIGLDVDGCFADFNTAFIQRVVDITGMDRFPERPFDIPCWNYPEHYGYSAEDTTRVWNSVTSDPLFWRNLPAYEDAWIALGKIAALNDDVYFITSRPGIQAKLQTEYWLRTHNYQNRPTVLISSAKGLCVRALKIDSYLDDRWENAMEAKAAGAQTFLIDRPWNREHDAEFFGIRRIYSPLEMLA